MNDAPKPQRAVRVELAERAYEVRIGPGLLGTLGASVAAALGGRPRAAFVVLDARVESHAQLGIHSLRNAGFRVTQASIAATEREKSIDTLARLLAEMGAARIERGEPVVAIGGGITGDVAGFAAATYRRGVPLVQCPTTLLSMVDASVGGKTGVNLEVAGTLQKNMVGAFHQPALVLADIDTLDTLPDREFRAGLAECLKHGLLDGRPDGAAGGTHLPWIEAHLDAILSRDRATLTELIARSVAFKAGVVAGDERELAEGGRTLLNLGHTFAHAIETLGRLSPTSRPADAPLLHGEAVALGLVAAATTSACLGRVGGELPQQVRTLLARCALPVAVAGLPDSPTLLGLMGADKKTTGGELRLVLPDPGCRASVVTAPDERAIVAGWDAVRADRTP